MRKAYRQILKKKFADMVSALPLPFQQYKGKSEYLSASDYAFVHHVKNDICLFMVLYVNPKGEQSFTVQFGWSKLGRYPEVPESQFPEIEVREDRLGLDEYIQRLGVFFGHDKWWYLEGDKKNWRGHMDWHEREVAPFEAEQAVDNSLAELKKTIDDELLPYFQKFLRTANSKPT